MYNELLFLGHIVIVSVSVLAGLAHSYAALLSVLGIQLILANIFVTKQIVLFGMTTTCSEVFIVGSMYGVSLIQAYYGTVYARRTIVYLFAMILLFVCLSYMHLLYEPIATNSVAPALQQVLGLGARFLFAGLIAYFVSERVNVLCASLLHARGVAPGARIVAIVIGQLVDTVVYTYVGLYGLMGNLASIIGFSFVIKCLVILALAPLLSIAQWLIPFNPRRVPRDV